MKNVFALLALSLLTLFFSCQSETKNTSSDAVAKATTSVPSPTPAATPAPVAAAPADNLTETEAMPDEAPAVPKEAAVAVKSVENTAVKPNATSVNTTQADKINEKVTSKKEDIDAQILAEKKKLSTEHARATAEQKKKAEAAAEIRKKEAEKAGGDMKDMVDEKSNMIKNTATEMTEKVKENVAFSHQIFDDLLKKHVSSSGKVNYAGFKQDQAKLTTYLKQLEAQPVESSWSKNKKLAYWINAYNANTISLIVDNYPVKSITDLEGGKPWDKKFINLDGKTLTLNNIENDIIRPTFKEPRIHFAVNCAAKSCPPLLNKAWTENNIQSELEKSTKAFINNAKYNTISSGSAMISKIFEWYAVDFGNLNDYLAKYNSEVNNATKISYNEYDWSLNN